MKLRLSQLRKILEGAARQERACNEVKRDLARAIGPSFDSSRGRLTELIGEAHDALDVLERAGALDVGAFRTAPLAELVGHPSAQVRRLAARLLPESRTRALVADPNHEVRHAIARRASPRTLREMIRRDPTDTLVREELRRRLVIEQKDDGASVAMHEGDELSDGFYESLAEKIFQDYGRRIEFGWERDAVSRLARSMRTTSGVNVDEARLLKALKSIMDDRDEKILSQPDRPIREVARRRRASRLLEAPDAGNPKVWSRMAIDDLASSLGARVTPEGGLTMGPLGERLLTITHISRHDFRVTLDVGYGDVEEATIPGDDEVDLAERVEEWLKRIGALKRK